MNKQRRTLLIGGAILGGASYINHRGLRYPRMGFSPAPLPTQLSNDAFDISLEDAIFLSQKNGAAHTQIEADIHVRCCIPNSVIRIGNKGKELRVRVNNVSPQATLAIAGEFNSSVKEQQIGIDRVLTIAEMRGESIELAWKRSNAEQLKYAVIGDTGGGDELSWCLARATSLDAEFLIHLGDLNYSEGEYQKAITALHTAPLPVFVCIGNHDFNDSGLVYPLFRNNIGPMNSAFSVAGSRLVLLDTAASFLPAYSGNRAFLVEKLKTQQAPIQAPIKVPIDDTVMFTHKPFFDVRGDEYHHDMSGVGEHAWVYQTMQDLASSTIVCGHVHRSSIDQYKDIKQITAGEGLGFEDIRYQQHSAKILLASTAPGRKTLFEWAELQMPWELHTSPTHKQKLEKYGLSEQLKWYEKLNSDDSPSAIQL